jgi:hypothetical protein
MRTTLRVLPAVGASKWGLVVESGSRESEPGKAFAFGGLCAGPDKAASGQRKE